MTEEERRSLVIFLVPVLHHVPSDTVVQREVGAGPPTVLHVASRIFMSRIVLLRIGLVKVAGDTDQEIGEIQSGLRARKQERTVKCRIWVNVDLVKAELQA